MEVRNIVYTKRVMIMKKRYTIGVVIGNANSPHTRTLMRGICDAAKKMNVNIIFFLGVHMANYYHEYFGENMENRHDFQYNVVYDYANLADVDGLIIAYGSLCIFLEDKNRQHFLNRFQGIPYVLVEDRDENKRGSSVISDNYQGMFEVVEHLIVDHGYKEFLFLSGPKDNTDAIEREHAFRDALKKHQIPFDEDHYAEGDFSQCCNKQIGELLDKYPHAEAFVCANDVMAETIYKECAARNIVVGRDIAVTGYDDWDMAESMTPPLTTVLQNELDMGHVCVKSIISLCDGNAPTDQLVPAIARIRASCGCTMTTEYDFPPTDRKNNKITSRYFEKVADILSRKALVSNASEDKRKLVKGYLLNLLSQNRGIYEYPDKYKVDTKAIMTGINEMMTGECGMYISPTTLVEAINSYIMHLSTKDEYKERAEVLLELSGTLLKCVQASLLKRHDEEEGRYEQDTMFIPLISRDMLSNMHDEVAFFEAPMKILKVLHAKSAYLYILEEPKEHRYGEKWDCPEKLRLVSYFEDDKIVSYHPKERPIIEKEAGMASHFEIQRDRIITGFNLFQGMNQYGIFLVEIDPAYMLLMHLVSMQISSSLNFFYMYQQQMEMKKQLEMLVEEVNEKNKILGFISEYDELTGLLNRRGFMERAMDFIHMSPNGRGILLIADLDHLKEINDCFGHVAGDFAIQSAAAILMNALGEDTLIARIGGDEFVAMLPYESGMSGEFYIQKLCKVYNDFNQNSKKDFYVEMSAGYTVFMCEEDMDFEAILASSDKMLYEAKQRRRSSIKKTQ